MKNKPNFFLITGFPKLGGWGPPLGNFSHIISVFFDRVPMDLVLKYKNLENTVNNNKNICSQEEVTKFETCLRQHNV